MKNISISEVMTASPHTVGVDQPVTAAHHLMEKYHIRHLPVLEGGKLVGILTDRDLSYIERFKDLEPQSLLVQDAMSLAVYSVTPDTSLGAVVKEMHAHRYGSVVVQDHSKVVGVFTTTDALRVLESLLK